MKRSIHLGATLLALSVCSWAAQPSTSVKNAVLAAENEWKAAVLKGDSNSLAKLFTADLSYTHSSTKTQTRAEFIADVTEGTTTYRAIDFADSKLRQYGSVVVVTHAATITTVQTGTSHLYLTEVWAQEEGRWRMASRQATKLP